MNLWRWFAGLTVAAVCAGAAPATTVLVLGDSLTAGYGVEKEEAYPALLQRQLARDGVNFINAGVSGNTTAGGLRRLKWAMRAKPDIVVIALGGNDGLRGLDPNASRANLEAIIDEARKITPTITILVAGMKSPPNMGKTYTDSFEAIFPAVAKSRNVGIVPFLLEGVAGVAEFNQADGIHPNAKGHAVMANILLPVLRELIHGSRSKQAE